MRVTALFLLVLGAVLDSVSLSELPAKESPQLLVTRANEGFAVEFYKTMATKQPTGDIFFSPMGIHTVLSMIYPGSDQETRTALTRALKVENPAQAAEGYDRILEDLNSVQNVTLHVANKVYLADRFHLKRQYGDVIKQKFHSEVEKADFASDVQAAADKVNGWVSQHTKGKIPTLFEPTDFSEDTRLVLLNAIYFKGNWLTKFDKVATRTEPFYMNGDEEKIDVQMMHRKGLYNFKIDRVLDAQVLEMPFNEVGVSMIVVLPHNIKGIDKLEADIDKYGLQTVMRDLQRDHVKVAFPKFKLETKMDLKVPLIDMGLGLLFDEKRCNLSKMIDNDEQLYISKIVQKAFVEVNENGAEATAATGATVTADRFTLVPIKFENFYVDHPFLIFLRKDNNLLFSGRVSRPVTADDKAEASKPNREDRPEVEVDYE